MNKIKQASIISLEEIKKINFRGKKKVLIGGAFDIMHTGHIEHFENAKSFGDVLIVHITGDKRYEEKKHRKPIFSAIQRAKIVSAVRFVDYVMILDDARHFDQEIIDIVCPDVLFFNQEAYENGAKEYIESALKFSGEIVVDNAEKINSSSVIINGIKNNIHVI